MRAAIQCWRLLSPRLRRRWLLLVPVSAAAALLDLLTGAVLLRAVSAIVGTGRADAGVGIGFLPGWLHEPSRLGAALAFLVLLKTALRILETATRERTAEHTVAELGGRLMRFWLDAPLRRHLETTPSQRVEDIQTLSNDVGRESIHSLMLLWSEGLAVLAVVILLLAAAPLPAVAVLAVFGGLAALTLRLAHWRHAGGVTTLLSARTQLGAFVQGSLAGVREIKIAGRAGLFVRRFLDTRAQVGRSLVSMDLWKQLPFFIHEALFLLGVVTLLALTRHSATGTASTPLLLLFLYAGLRLLPALNRVVYRALALRTARPSAERVASLLAAPASAPPAAMAGLAAPMSFTDSLVVQEVGFTYPQRTTPALVRATLTIRRGERVALVGPSGGGKSTLLLVLAGLLEPAEGVVTVDGVPLAVDDPRWHRQLGFVGQETVVLDQSLRENIALGQLVADIDPAALASAARIAQLDDVIAGLPAGLDTPLGEAGRALSGGQRQRVAIARALYAQPAVLLLDEATAHLDQPVEQRLIATLARERPALTTIFVTHRLATARTADRVVFVRAGRVEGLGTFAELAAHHAGFQAFLAAAGDTTT